MNTLANRLNSVFSIDVRALAVVRIALAIIILQDIVRRSFDISIFYGDGGVLPSQYVHTFWNGAYAWSFHLFFGGATPWVAALFAVEAIAAITFLVGYRTRIANVVVWLLIASLHNANPLILQGEDVLLRVTLFACMFLPLGAAYSFDRVRTGAPPRKLVLSGWTVAFLLQLSFMYFFVALYKQSPEWMHGDAIYYALSIDQYATAFGKWLLQFTAILKLLSISVLVFQSFALFLLFAPLRSSFVRTVTVALLMIMHASFAVSMNLGMFSAVAIAVLCGFLPSGVFDFAERVIAAHVSKAETIIRKLSVGDEGKDARKPTWMAAVVSLLGVLYVFYVFSWHVGNVLHPGQYVPFSHGLEIPAKALRIDQRWNLFAPYPYRHDGWIVIPATLESGNQIDLFRDGASLSFERPSVIYDLYPRPRWRRYFLSLWIDSNAQYRVPYARYLCRVWNEPGKLQSKVQVLSIVYMLEWTPAPGEKQEPIKPVTLLQWDCAKDAAIDSAK